MPFVAQQHRFPKALGSGQKKPISAVQKVIDKSVAEDKFGKIVDVNLAGIRGIRGSEDGDDLFKTGCISAPVKEAFFGDMSPSRSCTTIAQCWKEDFLFCTKTGSI